MRSNIQSSIIDRVLGIRRDRQSVVAVRCSRMTHRQLGRLFHQALMRLHSCLCALADAAATGVGRMILVRPVGVAVPVRVMRTTQTWQESTSKDGFGISGKYARKASKRGLRSY